MVDALPTKWYPRRALIVTLIKIDCTWISFACEAGTRSGPSRELFWCCRYHLAFVFVSNAIGRECGGNTPWFLERMLINFKYSLIMKMSLLIRSCCRVFNYKGNSVFTCFLLWLEIIIIKETEIKPSDFFVAVVII